MVATNKNNATDERYVSFDIPALQKKTCKICGEAKIPAEFYKTSLRCRKCATIQARESHQKSHPSNKLYPKIRWLD